MHSVRCLLIAFALLASSCSGSTGFTDTTQQIWVQDYQVLCSEIDEPDRYCLLIGHLENDLYRHIEGGIEGFEYEEGTRYLLEVEELETSAVDDPPYRLVEILRAQTD